MKFCVRNCKDLRMTTIGIICNLPNKKTKHNC